MDPEVDRAEEQASKQRKKAGIPELDVGALPSSVAQKMLNLGRI